MDPSIGGDTIESLVRSAQQGDRRAFRALYERFHQRVYRTAVRLLGDRVRSEDVVQDVFVKLFENLADFDFRSSFSTWLYRITVNTCYALMRKRERRERREQYQARDRMVDDLAPVAHGADAEAALSWNQVQYFVEEAIERLSPDLRATFVLRQMEGLSYREIGDVLDVSQGTVASRLARARRQLAETLRDAGIDESFFE